MKNVILMACVAVILGGCGQPDPEAGNHLVAGLVECPHTNVEINVRTADPAGVVTSALTACEVFSTADIRLDEEGSYFVDSLASNDTRFALLVGNERSENGAKFLQAIRRDITTREGRERK